ncbi:DUF305 domain-containing protein [Janibacter sp. YIM B02568]|uniref:DUF305 domain-containing protein n=1 Tax=Janibacter endophyticus TaxID=2806261 RepID=UPI0019522DA7|nr:DUF305 domain-containing protein [Janibacter endophyticus]MBM6544844.1 DUF305 domain-containing protein [Janibacter endophyticus]
MSPRTIVAALVTLAIGLASGVFIGRTSGNGGAPGDLSVDAGFARDMQTHHDQAVEMSLIVRDLTDDEDVRQIAYDIARTQAHQSGQMAGWLQAWGLTPTSSQPVMGWMDEHNHVGHGDMPETAEGALMPGMATAEELTRLKGLEGQEAEVFFLQLMIRHHQGGVPMAEAAVDSASEPEVSRLAQTIIDSQGVEMETMTTMLQERDAEPLS